jgi:hypothetical protein
MHCMTSGCHIKQPSPGFLTFRHVNPLDPTMTNPEDDQTFLKNLVKASRQKVHHVQWTDRDGTARQTALSQSDVVRLNTIAGKERISKSEVLRRAAHIPVEKAPRPAPPAVP